MTGHDPFVHPQSLCESAAIGRGTRIEAFSRVLPGARIGADCAIGDHVLIENDVVVGDGVTIRCGVQLWDGLRVGDGVVIGPNATFADDRPVRSGDRPGEAPATVVEAGVSIGANATILPGLRIGEGATVGAGAVVTRNVPPHAIVEGNPAVIVGYQSDGTSRPADLAKDAGRGLAREIGARIEIGVGRCWIERIPTFADMRGSLTALELDKGLPFVPQRVFMVYDVPNSHVRGEHAHHRCEQFLVAVRGSLSVMVDDGVRRGDVRLDDPSLGLYLAPGVWGSQYRFSKDGVLLVAASAPYDNDDYIRDYGAFRRIVTDRP